MPLADEDASGLSADQLSTFQREGYLIIPNFLTHEVTAKLLGEARDLLSNFDLSNHPLTTFATGHGDKPHIGDQYFLESGDKIRFFFEEDAIDPEGNLTRPKDKAINKIGHYLHSLSPTFKEATLTRQNAAIARDLGFKDPRVLQSMVICKSAGIGGRVPSHQDSTFLYTNPPSAVGFWIALEDSTAENGCLSFAKGSHRRTPVRTRLVRKDGGTGFQDNEGASFPQDVTPETFTSDGSEQYALGEVKAGSLVLSPSISPLFPSE